MANQWFRLWHDMPNDPKWRTIAKVSGRPIAEVIAVYLHLLNSASQCVTRGNASVTTEDLASAIDAETEHVEAIKNAMQGRVLEGDWLTGWDKRQVKKEEDTNPESRAKSNAERQREYRDRKRQVPCNDDVTASNEASRSVTTDKDKDKDKEQDLRDMPADAASQSKRKGTRLPADWNLSAELAQWAVTEKPGFPVTAEAARFRDYWTAKTGSAATKLDWGATWRNWVRASHFTPNNKPARHSGFAERDYSEGVTADGRF